MGNDIDAVMHISVGEAQIPPSYPLHGVRFDDGDIARKCRHQTTVLVP